MKHWWLSKFDNPNDAVYFMNMLNDTGIPPEHIKFSTHWNSGSQTVQAIVVYYRSTKMSDVA